LVAGGTDDLNHSLTAEIYDSKKRIFKLTGKMNFFRYEHTDGLIKKAESVHAVSSRNLKTDNTMSELEKLVVAATEFLYCSVLYEWRGDAEDSDRHLVSGQICDVRSSIIIGNGGVIGG
jgi:hypothetical protein